MDLWKFIYNRLLEDSERDCDGLEIFGTCGNMDVDGLESGLIYYWGLSFY